MEASSSVNPKLVSLSLYGTEGDGEMTKAAAVFSFLESGWKWHNGRRAQVTPLRHRYPWNQSSGRLVCARFVPPQDGEIQDRPEMNEIRETLEPLTSSVLWETWRREGRVNHNTCDLRHFSKQRGRRRKMSGRNWHPRRLHIQGRWEWVVFHRAVMSSHRCLVRSTLLFWNTRSHPEAQMNYWL